MSEVVQNKALAVVGLVIALMIYLVCLPIVIDQIDAALADSATWNFTGHEGAATLLGLTPFIFIAGLIVYFIGSILGKW